MNCIFCKKDSSNSISIEHIIPESLGNETHILPKGIVCDSCNNYFSVKIEKPLLEQPYFRNVRYRNIIRSKKGNLIPYKTILMHLKHKGWIDMWIDEEGLIFRHEDADIVRNGSKGVIIPTIDAPEKNNYIVSRFLAKAALELIVYKDCSTKEWLDEVTNTEELNSLREYARYGKGQFWEYNQRRIYDEEDRFCNPVHHPDPYEILHEMDFLCIDDNYLYYILVIMGIEYAINLGGPKIETYKEWLEHNNISPIRRYSEYKIPRSK